MKKTIRMNERELHRMISESVKRVLNEHTDDEYERISDYWLDLAYRDNDGEFMVVEFFGRRPDACLYKGSWKACCHKALAAEINNTNKNGWYKIVPVEPDGDGFMGMQDEYDHCYDMGDFDY